MEQKLRFGLVSWGFFFFFLLSVHTKKLHKIKVKKKLLFFVKTNYETFSIVSYSTRVTPTRDLYIMTLDTGGGDCIIIPGNTARPRDTWSLFARTLEIHSFEFVP